MTRFFQVRAPLTGIFCGVIDGLGAQLKRLVLLRTLRKIEQLDDHVLREIGLSRHDVITIRRYT